MKIKFETVIDTDSNEEVTALFNTMANNIASSMDLSLMDKDAHSEVMHHLKESFVYGGLNQLAREWCQQGEGGVSKAMHTMNKSIVKGEKGNM